MINIRKLETELWEAADLLRADSKVTSQEYCMPVLGLIFLRYAYSRFKFVEADILKNRPVRNGRVLPVEADDFKTKSAIFLPEEARYDYLINLPDNTDMGQAINRAMELIEEQSAQLKGILPKNYTILQNDLLRELLRIFNNSAFNEMKDDIIGRIYEYFLNKFAPAVASDDGVFFTPKSLVRMIVNIIEPTHGTVLDPACGSGGMFVSSADFIEGYGANANTAMTFYGQEKVDYNAKLCIMNMAVHGLNAKIVSGDEANSFYHDAHNLEGCCDYVMANPPFNVDKIKAKSASDAGRLPFGLPGVNKNKEIGNANYLWISYFHAYLNEMGRAGFVMASSATDSQGKDKDIREQLIKTGDVDVMLSVGNNFFYTKSLPCTLWFFDKAKRAENKDKILFIDARNYYTVVDRTLNEWSEWQMKNLNAIVWLYRGEIDKYTALIQQYKNAFLDYATSAADMELDEILRKYADFFSLKTAMESYLAEKRKRAKECIETVEKRKKKAEQAKWDEYLSWIEEIISVTKEACWLYEKFGDGEYKDILGLCKCASIEEIEQKGWSLTSGAYVGVAPVEDDGVDFAERMAEIHAELLALQSESNELMTTISKNMEEMGL
ncbi:MAG: SAM-dependent DNA methyltransferase [Clostridia bacterium]|nr:SAM-dependent DNA methyltransferase [Clostridia bacterium]